MFYQGNLQSCLHLRERELEMECGAGVAMTACPPLLALLVLYWVTNTGVELRSLCLLGTLLLSDRVLHFFLGTA
jgi:hypothetical protein